MAYLPQGTVAQVESRKKHRLFMHAVEPDYVLLKIQHARRLVKRDETADSWAPDGTTVITSTAIKDNRNNALPLEGNGYKRGEWDIIREFEPDFHLPADRPDYKDTDDDQRYEYVKECMTGTIAIANHLANSDVKTSVIPWIKGVKPEERHLAYRTIEQLGLDYAGFYANGYFNDNNGIKIDELIDDLELISRETTEQVDTTEGALNLFVLNCQSPNVLSDFPPNVVASSGLWVGQNRGWREKITPTKQSDDEIREIFDRVDADVRIALGLPESREQAPRKATQAEKPNNTTAETHSTE